MPGEMAAKEKGREIVNSRPYIFVWLIWLFVQIFCFDVIFL